MHRSGKNGQGDRIPCQRNLYLRPSGETHQDRMDSINLSRDLQLDMVRFNNATPYPGTELYEIAKSEKRLNVQGLWENFNSVSTFIENPFNRIPFHMCRRVIPKKRYGEIYCSVTSVIILISRG